MSAGPAALTGATPSSSSPDEIFQDVSQAAPRCKEDTVIAFRQKLYNGGKVGQDRHSNGLGLKDQERKVNRFWVTGTLT